MSLSWYRHTQLVFSGGLAPLAAQRVDGTGTEQQGGPPLGRAMAWPWPLACKVRSGALGGKAKDNFSTAACQFKSMFIIDFFIRVQQGA